MNEHVLNVFTLWAWTVFFLAKALIFGYGAWTTWVNQGTSRLALATKWFFTTMAISDFSAAIVFGIAAIDTTEFFDYDPSTLVRVVIRIASIPFLVAVLITGTIFVTVLRRRIRSLIKFEEEHRL